MRQNEFRGKRLDNGEWMYGDLVHDNQGGCYIYPLDSLGLFVENKVDPNTVGEFIGLVDKKDNKIYDGDILFVEFADKSGGYQLVGWNEKTASWGIMDDYSYQSMKEGYDYAEFKNHVLLAFLKDALICEVAGNIHDDPKLPNRIVR